MAVVKKLVWDEWNVTHIARHGVIPQEVEEVCHGDVATLDGKKGRIVAIGLTKGGRMLAIILDPENEEGSYYPVTARSASRGERRKYRKEKGVEQ